MQPRHHLRARLTLVAAALLLPTACRKPTLPPRNSDLPPILLWAWQEPEDLRSLDPHRLGVAVLAETILLSDHLTALPRHQPLRLAPGTRVVLVVRIEAIRGFRDTPGLRSALAHHLAGLATHSPTSALQLDFDAVVSQYPFYAATLQLLRRQLPPSLPLTITALVSWCHAPSWLSFLPPNTLDAAVPMFFRMGGPAAHTPSAANPLHPAAPAPSPEPLPPLIPLCQTSLGLSTDEPWPHLPSARTLYLFSPGPWTTEEIHTLNTLDLSHPAALTR